MEQLIFKTINEVMKKINAIGKDSFNETQKFKYRGIDDVMNELHPAMAECGLFVVPEVLSEERSEKTSKSGGLLFYTRQKIQFTFYALDGSNLSAVVIGEAMDSGDKASNKALSIGLKYALLQVLCIPTEDDKDPDGQSHELTAPDTKGQPARNRAEKPQPKGGKDTPTQQEEIKSLLKATYANGEPIFAPDFHKTIGTMRFEKTAQEVIDYLKTQISKARTEKQSDNSADEFKDDLF